MELKLRDNKMRRHKVIIAVTEVRHLLKRNLTFLKTQRNLLCMASTHTTLR